MVQQFYAEGFKTRVELGFGIDVEDAETLGSATAQQHTDRVLRGGAHDEKWGCNRQRRKGQELRVEKSCDILIAGNFSGHGYARRRKRKVKFRLREILLKTSIDVFLASGEPCNTYSIH